AEDGKDLVHKMQIKRPDVLLMDIRMPEVDGINAIGLLRKEYEDVKIIVLTMYDDQEMISKMMEMGANAYLTKTTDPDEIYQAILTCMNDDFYFNDLVNKAVLSKLQTKRQVRQFYPSPIKFSEKEIRILKLLAEDKTTEEISKEVFLSTRTIETIRQNMKTKIGAKTIAGLIMYAMRNKIID
ncbi:MAG TPA: response regulator transcription factor, partial [Puia sp.]|nr:response regulator transcription factor [Puia sp.]